MASGKKVSELTELLQTSLLGTDLFEIARVGDKNYKMTITELGKEFNAVPNLNFSNQTSNYTILAADDYVKCDTNGGAFTVTLPDASANSGKVIRIQKVNVDLDKVTIDTTGSDTVDGAADTFLLGHDEYVDLASDGVSDWQVLNWDEGKEIQGTNVWGEINNIDLSQYSITFKRKRMFIYEGYTTWTGSGGSGAVASWVLPGGLQIDTTARVAGTNALNHDRATYGLASVFTTAWVNYVIHYQSSTSVRFSASSITLTYANLTASDSVRFAGVVVIPIA